MRLVLDAEAVVALMDRRHSAREKVRAYIDTARVLQREVAIASVTLAEIYRTRARNHELDALLARESDSLLLRDTDRALVRLVGGVLGASGVGWSHLAAAHAVAVAVEAGGGVVLTSDPRDLRKLAAPYPNVVIEALS